MAKIDMVYTRPSSTFNGVGYGEMLEGVEQAKRKGEDGKLTEPSEVDEMRNAGFVTVKEFCDRNATKAAAELKRGNDKAAEAFARRASKLDPKHTGAAVVLKKLGVEDADEAEADGPDSS